MQCLCGSKFFIIHTKTISFYGNRNEYFHLFHDHPSLDIGYSIYECKSCRELYICKKFYKNSEKSIISFINVKAFNQDNAESFLSRAKLMTPYLQYNDQFVSNMIMKVE